MNLQIFDNYTSRKHSTGRPSIRSIAFYLSNGSVTFSSKTCEELHITEETKVLFAKDTESRKDWYFAVSSELENGIQIRQKKNGGVCKNKPSLSCSCRVVVESILKDYKGTKNGLFMVSAKGKEIDGLKWYQIINNPLRIDGKDITE